MRVIDKLIKKKRFGCFKDPSDRKEWIEKKKRELYKLMCKNYISHLSFQYGLAAKEFSGPSEKTVQYQIELNLFEEEIHFLKKIEKTHSPMIAVPSAEDRVAVYTVSLGDAELYPVLQYLLSDDFR